jgi:hypothetical protein
MKSFDSGKKKIAPISSVSHAGGVLDLPIIGHISDVEGKLYNQGGRLFWQGMDLSAIMESRGDWSPASRAGDIHRASGRVGIGTSDPQSDLHVEGGIYGAHIRIRGISGVLKGERGNIDGGASLDDLFDVRAGQASDGDVLMRRDGSWVSSHPSAISVSHSDVSDKDDDDHPQYLTDGRHSSLRHDLGEMNVAGMFHASGLGVGIGTDRPGARLDVAGSVRVGSLDIEGVTGVLKTSPDGRVVGSATTADVTEVGSRPYFSEERVLHVTDGRYLRVDATNAPTGTIKGFDADRLDGKEAADFATAAHSHRHSDMASIGEDDHHPRKHQMFGDDHSIPEGSTRGSVPVLGIGSFEVRPLAFDDVRGSIPIARVDMGTITPEDLSHVVGVRSSVQTQIDTKAAIRHSHPHFDLDGGFDADDHEQYLNAERISAWMESRTTDDLRQGSRNAYFSQEVVIEITGKRYLSLDGSNVSAMRWPDGVLSGLDAERVGGLTVSSLSRSDHVHRHSDIIGASEDDHHLRSHDLIGSDHRFPRGFSGFLSVDEDGVAMVKTMSESDIVGGISLSRVSGLRVALDEVNGVSGLRGNVQEQIDSKSDAGHFHSHSDIRMSSSSDDHPQYMNPLRAEAWFLSKTTDDIREGEENLYFDQSRVRSSLSAVAPLSYDMTNGRFSISTGMGLIVRDGSFCLPQDVGPNASPTFASVSSTGDIVARRVGIGVNNPGVDLHVRGEAVIDTLHLGLRDGVAFVKDGRVDTGARLQDLSGVSLASPSEGDHLVFDGTSWVGRPAGTMSEDLRVGIASLVESIPDRFDEDSHDVRPHIIPSLKVSRMMFVGDDGVGIGGAAPKNMLDVAGSAVIGASLAGRAVAPDGCLLVEGSVGIGVSNPASTLDIGTGKISGGSFSSRRRNVLDLSSSGDVDSVSFKMSSGGEIALFHDRKDDEVGVSLSQEGWLSSSSGITTVAGRMVEVSIGGTRTATFSKDGLSLGADRDAKFNLDASGFIGVSCGGQKATNFIVLRANRAESSPTICFPADRDLLFGTFKSYDAASVWSEAMSVDANGNIKMSGSILVGVKSMSVGSEFLIDASSAGFLKMRATEDEASVVGISGGKDGRLLIVKNSGEKPIMLLSESSVSSAENRMSGDERSLRPGEMVQMVYDADISRWSVVG